MRCLQLWKVVHWKTVRNVETRWAEHENINKDFEPAKHLRDNVDHTFAWKILSAAPKHFRKRKNLEASFIALRNPPLNNQLDSKQLHLFRNGVT